MKGRKRGRSAWVLSVGLAALLCALTAQPQAAYGAIDIDTAKTDCRIDFTLDVDILDQAGETGNLGAAVPDYDQYYGELAEFLKGGSGENPSGADSDTEGGVEAHPQKAIQVNLYKIADVDAGGHYKVLKDYAGSDVLLGVEAANADTTAGQWSHWAAEAARMAVGTMGEDGILVPPAAGEREPDGSAEITLQDGKAGGAAEGLSVGLYLVNVEPVETAAYRYSFIPYLVSLPNRSYAVQEGDEWIYGDEEGKRIYVGLKPEREDRYGDLVIEKKITAYSETFQGASFVFEVKAVKDDRVVYNDLVSLTFDSFGTQSARIQNIPAGAEATVTEVYSGAGYAPVDGTYVRSTIIEAQSDAARVSFENQYNGTQNGGNASVVNHFVYGRDETGREDLQWEKLEGGQEPGGGDR